MKICAACSHTLPKDKFSKKQWQAKQQKRRCKECIVDNRAVNAEVEAPNDEPPRPSESADGKVASRWTDDDLFRESPPGEECPICMLPLPRNISETSYQACCGKTLCVGCLHADRIENSRIICPFCRAPLVTSEGEYIKIVEKRVGADDPVAMCSLGGHYYRGERGLPQNCKKAMKLWIRAGELGCTEGYHNVGVSYDNGHGVERDTTKAQHYYELAAMGGNVIARCNLGLLEVKAGNTDRAVRHWMIGARAGYDKSLKAIREGYVNGHVTKTDFEKALRAHKDAKDEMKSEQRETAAAYYNLDK